MDGCTYDIIHVFQRKELLNNSVVIVPIYYYNKQKEKISYPEGKFDLHSKYTMWKGYMKFLT